MSERKNLTIQQRLQHDKSIFLDYGAPLETIPYMKISEVKTPYFESDDELVTAYNLVESEKDSGKPRGFVTRQSEVGKDDHVYDIITVWSWQD